MSDAFDATADALARQVLAAFPAVRAYGRSDLGRLPVPVARTLAIHLDVAAERALPVSRWLDASDDRLREATDAWLDAARAAAQVPATEWAETVRAAVRQALSHLVRPVETLADAAFEGRAEAVPFDMALRRMRAFGAYDYLPEIAGRYAERKGLDRIDRDGLATLLRRIDRRMLAAFGAEEWQTLLGPLVEWAGSVGEPAGTVPAALLRDALDARDADFVDAFDDGADVSESQIRERLRTSLSVPEPTPASELLPGTSPAPDPSRLPEPSPGTAASAPESLPPTAPVDPEPEPEPEAPEPDDPTSAEPADAPEPPVTIGSRFRSPEFDRRDESEVLGAPRVADRFVETPDAEPEPPPEAEPEPTRMDEVRDALAVPMDAPDEPPPAPPVPVLHIDAADLPDPEDETPALVDEPETVPPAPAASAPDETPIWQRMLDPAGGALEATEAPTPADGEETPLWKRFAQSDLATRLPDAPGAPPPVLPDAAADAEPDEEPSALDAVERRVLGAGASDRRGWFVAALFEGSTAEYHRTLDRIGRTTSYTEATRVISEEVFRRHHVSPYTEAAVAFIDAVQERFGDR